MDQDQEKPHEKKTYVTIKFGGTTQLLHPGYDNKTEALQAINAWKRLHGAMLVPEYVFGTYEKD